MGEMVEFFFIGYAGEINARRKPIDISDLLDRWPEASPVLMVNRPKEEAPYPAETTLEGSTLYWEVSDIDVAKSGFGQAQVYMRDADGELLGKSEVINTLIKASLNGAEQEKPPTAVETWVTKFLDAHNEAKEGYVPKDQGAENAGKVLGIGADGIVAPMTVSGTGGGSSVEVDATLTQSGQAADAAVVGEKLNELNEAIANKAYGVNSKIIAHRGYYADSPSNTVGAFKEAVADGFKWIELDIRVTADNVLILAHDTGITLYSNGVSQSYTIGQTNYEDIKNHTWDADGLHKIATMQATFAAMRGYDVRIICDRKTGTNADILRIAAQSGMLDKIMISYNSPSAVISDASLLNRYKSVPIRVVLGSYADTLSMMQTVSNPIYADANATTNYKETLAVAFALGIPIIMANCSSSNAARWCGVADGFMAQANMSYADLLALLPTDYSGGVEITPSATSVSVAASGAATITAEADATDARGYIYAYTTDPTVATVTQETFGTSVSITLNGIKEGSTDLILFTSTGTRVSIPVTVAVDAGGGEPDTTETYSVTNNLTNVSTSNSATSVEQNAAYSATLAAHSGYTLATVTVTMGGADVTSTVYADGAITIDSVTGDVVITAEAVEDGGFTPVTLTSADLVYTTEAKPNNDGSIGVYGSRIAITSAHTQTATMTNSFFEGHDNHGVVFYPFPIPEGASTVAINCGGLKWNGYLYTEAMGKLRSLSAVTSGTTQSVDVSGATWAAFMLQDSDSETVEVDTDTSSFTVVFS